jgi:hypothetical protein
MRLSSHRCRALPSVCKYISLTVAVIVVLAISGAAPASAATSPPPYLDEALDARLWNTVSGETLAGYVSRRVVKA